MHILHDEINSIITFCMIFNDLFYSTQDLNLHPYSNHNVLHDVELFHINDM
jgi:hypothetical protein